MNRTTVTIFATVAVIVALLFLAHTFNLAGIARSVHGG